MFLSQACGSEDAKKAPPKQTFNPNDGGEGGGDGTGGTNTGATSGSSTGATSGEGAGGEPVGSTGGTPGMTGEAGANATGNGGAAGGTGDDCEPGFGECDNNPDTVCEQDLTSVNTCGDCNISCSSANGAVVCEDLQCKITSCDANYGDCNDDGTDGCETNLLNNAADCGECGRDCATLGATCNTNRCATIPMQQGIAGGSDGGANLMWVYSPDGLMNAASYNYAIQRYPLSGTGTNTVWTGTAVTIGYMSMFVEGNDLIWAERGAPSVVMRKPITAAAGDPPTFMFYPEYQPMFFTRVVNTYYWITGDYQAGEPSYVYSRLASAASNVPGTRIVTVSQGTHGYVNAFAVTSNAIYWVTENDGAAGTTDNDLRTTPLNGGTPTSVPPAPGAADGVITGSLDPRLQVLGDTLYFTRTVATSPVNGVYRFKTGDAAPELVVSVNQITSMLVDDTYVYYTSQSGGAGVWRAPHTPPGAGVQLSDTGVTRIIAQDDDFIYGLASGCCSSNVFKVIK